MYHPSRNARKKVLCWVHTWPLFIAFSAEKRKNSLLSLFGRFDRHLSHHHRVVSIFPLLTRARTQSRRFRKKNARERGFDTWKTSSLARKLHSRTPRSVRVSLFYSQKQNQTHANSASSRKVVTRVDFLSLRKRKK